MQNNQVIDLGDEIKFTVKYKGKEYVLREPSVAEAESLKENPNGFLDFLAQLGMPKEVLMAMGLSKAKALVEGMLELVTKKK